MPERNDIIWLDFETTKGCEIPPGIGVVEQELQQKEK